MKVKIKYIRIIICCNNYNINRGSQLPWSAKVKFSMRTYFGI